MKLSPVIRVDDEKCVNCHQCISVCPIKFCMDGSGEIIKLNHELCIACGNCITACTHEARLTMDDFSEFLEDVNKKPMVAIVAPAVSATFKDDMLRVNGMLKSFGIEAVFDVSFGAELTVKSYLHHIKNNNPKTVISQPCPAIVNYIELYQPELIKHLAPADSPMLHTIKMIKNYYKEYKNHKVVVISPCLAKKREFEATGMGDYNLTLDSIENYLEENSKSIKSYNEVMFDSPDPERAVLFSTPGGLLATLEREAPEAAKRTRKIEGPEQVYDYLKELPASLNKGIQPLLVDCLNCEKGCNGGTGTRNKELSLDELEHSVQSRADKNINTNKKKIKKALNKYWDKDLFNRSYTDRSPLYNMNTPTEERQWKIYNEMHKYETEHIYNCASCGYNSCDQMAKAIHNGLNKPDNCHHYQISIVNIAKENSINLSNSLKHKIDESTDGIVVVEEMVDNLLNRTSGQRVAIEETTAAVNQMMSSITLVDSHLQDKKTMVNDLQASAQSKIVGLKSMVRSIEEVVLSVDKVHGFNETINDVAENTNLLAMNAAIEAAHAGEHGRGFNVVATEIRKLAEKSGQNAHNIALDLKKITSDIENSMDVSLSNSRDMEHIISQFSTIAFSLTEISENMTQMSAGSQQIQSAMGEMVETSNHIHEFGKEMDNVVHDMTRIFKELQELSKTGQSII